MRTPRHQTALKRRSISDGDTAPLLPLTSTDNEAGPRHAYKKKEEAGASSLCSVDCKPLATSIMYGVINSILTIPCMYGYAAIIFSHHDFAPLMPSLSKLVMFSSVVHQVMFTLLSTLPFAIGQVQVKNSSLIADTADPVTLQSLFCV